MVLLDVHNPFLIEDRPSQSTTSSLSMIESAYDLKADKQAWLASLLQQVRPFIDGGLGVYGVFYEASEDATALRLDTPIFVNCPPGFPEALSTVTALSPAELLRPITHGGPPCHSLSQVFAVAGVTYSEFEPIRQLRREAGVGDLLIVNAWTEQRRGCCLVAPVDRERRFPARTASTLARAARHIAAAQRLRRTVLNVAGQVALEAEAVLDEQGALLHAEGEAQGKLEREALQSSARNLVSARRQLRETDPEQVALIWKALVDGRWSLVDSFDRDGKRFLFARRNALELPEPSSLTPIERQVAALFARGHSSKLVSYELGLSASSVSSALQRALRKLHLRSSTELVALFNPR